MIKKLIFFTSLIALLFSCTSDGTFKVKGVIPGAEGEKIYLQQFDVAGVDNSDSTVIRNNGKFTFKQNLHASGFYGLKFNNNLISLVVHPGDEILIESDSTFNLKNLKIQGSEESEKILTIQQNLQETKSKLESVTDQYAKALQNRSEQSILNRLSEKYDSILNAQRKENVAYIIQNTNKLSSLLVLYQQLEKDIYVLNRVRDIQYYRILTDSLKKYYPESNYVLALENNTREFLSRYNTQRIFNKYSDLTESTLPVLALPNLHGDTIKVNDLKGKILILNFWASWDQLSVQQTRRFSGIYNKYKKRGLEIYSVSLDNNKQRWEAAVKFDEFNWINVSDLSYPESKSARVYNIQKLPTYYLVNRDQTDILGKNLTIEELDRRLNKLLNE